MGSGTKVAERLTARVNELSESVVGCMAAFGKKKLFTGPSFYFHNKTLARQREHSTISNLLDDHEFFDWLYATLTAWGLHRMGPGNTKLRDIDVLMKSVRAHQSQIEKLSAIS